MTRRELLVTAGALTLAKPLSVSDLKQIEVVGTQIEKGDVPL